MHQVKIKKQGSTTNQASFGTLDLANEWLAQEVANNSFGKPERTVEANSEPYTQDDVLEEIPATEEEPAKVRLRAQYTIEIEDLGNSLVLAELRHRRDALLAQTDWTQVNDAPLSSEQKAAYASYRQALRDLPSNNTNVASLDEVQFPSKPE